MVSITVLASPRRATYRDSCSVSCTVSLTYFVPDSTPALKPVRHFGTNSLPMFRAFEKPMFRDAGGILGGRNVQTWQAFTGPGYYVVEPPQGSNELVLDYTRLPGAAPDGWPKLKSNEGGLSHFVFRGLRDTMRYVSEHVSIGTAIRDGKPQEQYFILVREN